MITNQQLFICKELIDVVDDILHETLVDEYKGRLYYETEGILDVFENIVDAHNNMLSVYCNFINDENDRKCSEIRTKIQDLVEEMSKEGGDQ